MDIKIFTDNIEDKAREQIDTLMSLDAFKDCKVRIMPDVHAGAGCVIGFTADLGDKVIPNIVGVDIGCGMLVIELGKIDIDFEELDKVIHDRVPAGMNVFTKADDVVFYNYLSKLYCYEELRNKEHIMASMGTLGGGNHFIEVDQDDEGNKFLVIHTGSRNLGKQVAEIYQQLAIDTLSGKVNRKEELDQLIQSYKEAGRQSELQNAIQQFNIDFKLRYPEIPNELCYLEGTNREKYLHDMKVCQEFAIANRASIGAAIMTAMDWDFKDAFSSIHNYISFKDNIVRKGAISAQKGEKVIIPMNMRDGCIIGIGKGNDDWNQSAPHGAGRIMSRAAAKQQIKLEDYEASMQGIYSSTVDLSTIDEAPAAYKPMQEIIDHIQDTVKIVNIIKPIYNFKASE